LGSSFTSSLAEPLLWRIARLCTPSLPNILNRSRSNYDRSNRQIKIIDANNITTQITTYDGFGNVKSIKDAGGNETKYDYDKLDRLTKTIDPRTKQTIQSYDGLGRVTSLTDRNNRTRTFAYDINDNLTSEQWGGTIQLTYTYDKVGNRTSSVDASSNTTNTYGYDPIYQLTSAATSNSNVRFEYDYDEFGDLTGRKDKQSTSTIAQLDYIYNNNHQLTRLTQSGVGLATQNIDFTYDKLSQLKQVDRSVTTNPGHLVSDYQYDGAGRLFDIKNKFNSTVISDYAYGYDDGNRLSGKSGTDGISTVDYGKDNQISAVNNTNRPDEAYSFNALGIRAGWVTDALDKRRVLNDGTYQCCITIGQGITIRVWGGLLVKIRLGLGVGILISIAMLGIILLILPILRVSLLSYLSWLWLRVRLSLRD
jgi:YD repeat-containing protein